jgi:hypothetical protein
LDCDGDVLELRVKEFLVHVAKLLQIMARNVLEMFDYKKIGNTNVKFCWEF